MYNDNLGNKSKLSEWVIVAWRQFLQLYRGENRLIVNEMMMRSALY